MKLEPTGLETWHDTPTRHPAANIGDLPASKITSGTLDWARLSANFPRVIADILSDHDKAAHDALNIDADTVDGEEAAAIVTDARVKAHFPDTIANILSDHDLTRHPLAIIPTMDDEHIPNLETLSYGGAFAAAQIPNLDASKITTGTLGDARIPAGIARDAEVDSKITTHAGVADAHHAVHVKTLADHPLSIIPTMDDAHIPNLETLSYGGAFAVAQIPTLTIAKISDIPGTIANILTDHTKAVHDALGLSHDSLSDVSANDHRHIEAKNTPESGSVETVTWTTAFSSTPVVGATPIHSYPLSVSVQSRSTTAATISKAQLHDGDMYSCVRCVLATEVT